MGWTQHADRASYLSARKARLKATNKCTTCGARAPVVGMHTCQICRDRRRARERPMREAAAARRAGQPTRPRPGPQCTRCTAPPAPGGVLCLEHAALENDPEVARLRRLADEEGVVDRRKKRAARKKAAPEELYCGTCDDWRPEAEVEHCDGCGSGHCHEHRHHETCAGPPRQAA